MSDTVYYSDSSIQVTDKEIKLPHRKYSLHDVRSVGIASMGIEATTLRNGRFFYMYAIYVLGTRLIEEPDALRFSINLREGVPVFDIGLVYVFISIVIAARAYVLYKSNSNRQKQIFIATISGSFSKAIAAASLRKDYVEEVADAIKRAVSGVSPNTTQSPEEPNNGHDVLFYQYEADGQNRQGVWLDGKVYNAQDLRIPEEVSAWTYPQGALVGLIADISILCILISLIWARIIPEGGFPSVGIALIPIFGSYLAINSTMWLRGWREVYLVKLLTSSWTDYVFASIDAQRVQKVVDALSPLSLYSNSSRYIADSVVEVNDTMARFGRRKFPIEDIQTLDVQIMKSSSRKQLWFGTAALTLAAALVALDFYLGSDNAHWLAILTAPLLILPGVVLILMSNKTTYPLTLQGRFGEVQAYSSHSELYVRKIATALRRVIMQKREGMEAQSS